MELTVNINGLKACSDELEDIYKQLIYAKASLDRCKWGLNSYMLSSSYWNIRLNLGNLSRSIDNQINHVKLLRQNLREIADLYSKTELSILDIDKTQAEIEAKEKQFRQNLANIAKFAVFALCVVATAAVIVGTGGAATPLVLGGVAALTSVATTATNSLADEYAEKGNFDDMDWKEFGKDITVAGVTGFITGWAGGTITEGLKGISLVKSGLESTHFLSRFATNACVNAISETTVGIGERGVSNFADVMMSNDMSTNMKAIGNLGIYGLGTITHDSALKNMALQDENAARIINDSLDIKEIGKDAVKGVISASVDEIVDSASTVKHFDSKYLNSDNSAKRAVSNFVVEGAKGTVSSIGERFESDLIDGKSIKEASETAFNQKEIIKDFVSDGIKGGTEHYYGKPIGEAVLTEKKAGAPDILKSIPDNAPNARDWVKDGGKIYIDSANKVTFEKSVSEAKTPFTNPKIRLCYSK